MKKVTFPKFVIDIGAFILILIGFFCGYKCSESLKKNVVKKCEPEIKYVEICEKEEIEEISEFELGDNKYIITTNTKFITMQNDGGSHTNIYYEIDLNEKIATIKEDKYVGFKGYEYQGKVNNTITLEDEQVLRLKEIIEELEENPEQGKDDIEFLFYVLTTKDYEEIRIMDEEIIKEINEMMK